MGICPQLNLAPRRLAAGIDNFHIFEYLHVNVERWNRYPRTLVQARVEALSQEIALCNALNEGEAAASPFYLAICSRRAARLAVTVSCEIV